MYYPKSQIKSNLYTNGTEQILLLITTKQKYVGYYYQTSTGALFTGRYPGDGENILLIKEPMGEFIVTPESQSVYTVTNGGVYAELKNIDVTKYIILPKYIPNIPTDNDYQIGEFRRYFCKKFNEILYLEIDKNYYDKLVKENSKVAIEYYQPFNIPWKLTGAPDQVYNTNRNIVVLTMKTFKLPKFDKYLQEDYVKFYKKSLAD